MRAPWTTPPPLGSSAPKRSDLIRASDMAAAHIAHGSSVTHMSHSSSLDVPSLAAAARIASISACAVGSSEPRIALRVAATISSPRVTTAPTGTSPSMAASRARSSARRIGKGNGKLIGAAASAAPPTSQLHPVVRRRGYLVLRLILWRLHLERLHLHGRLPAPDLHRSGLDVKGRRLPALGHHAIVGGRNLRG